MIRGALVALLKLEPDIEVVAELDRGDHVVETALRTTPDVAVRRHRHAGTRRAERRGGAARAVAVVSHTRADGAEPARQPAARAQGARARLSR